MDPLAIRFRSPEHDDHTIERAVEDEWAALVRGVYLRAGVAADVERLGERVRAETSWRLRVRSAARWQRFENYDGCLVHAQALMSSCPGLRARAPLFSPKFPP